VGAVASPHVPHDGIVRIYRERKGRHGKTVSLITGLPGSEDELLALAHTLKRLCGAGGSVQEGQIVIQGDHRDTLATFLAKAGHRVKLAGG
jgi:translation initiation factor 1